MASYTPAERRAYGGLALSCAGATDLSLGVRPVNWHNSLTRLGITTSLLITHDIGAALLGTPQSIGPREDVAKLAIPGLSDDQRDELLKQYSRVLREIEGSEVSVQLRAAQVDDSVITTLLARILTPLSERWRGSRAGEVIAPSADTFAAALAQLQPLWASIERRVDVEMLFHLVKHRFHLLLALEQIDLDTLELLRLFGRDAGALPETELVDLLQVFSSPEANDVVNFSLDILPSVLETRRGGGQQVFSVDGYSGVMTNGSLDSLVLTEMANDDDLFEQRFLDNEMLYYSHEAQLKPPPRVYQILVDASASMRGARNVFARGVALALAKKMSLLGFEASVRFFDSRLYEPLRLRRVGRSAAMSPPHIAGILTFKGENGRNNARVFSQFASEVDRMGDHASLVAYVITHAECHIPVELVRRIREKADLYGVFMLPSRGALELDYLQYLTHYEVVDERAIRDRSERASRALSIVENASNTARGSRTSIAPPPPRDSNAPAE